MPGWVALVPVLALTLGWAVQAVAWRRRAGHPPTSEWADAVPSSGPVGAAPVSMGASGWLVAYTCCCAAGYSGWAIYQAVTVLGAGRRAREKR